MSIGSESGLTTGHARATEPQPTLFTIGYEGRSKDEFVGVLQHYGVRGLVDVRALAWSRKPGFSSTLLHETLTANGISYTHIRALGSPRKVREELKSKGDFGAFAKAYSKHLAEQTESLDMLISAALLQPTAIMCFEKDPSRCHRSLIASRLASMGFSVEDI